jgi:hypothetical protein
MRAKLALGVCFGAMLLLAGGAAAVVQGVQVAVRAACDCGTGTVQPAVTQAKQAGAALRDQALGEAGRVEGLPTASVAAAQAQVSGAQALGLALLRGCGPADPGDAWQWDTFAWAEGYEAWFESDGGPCAAAALPAPLPVPLPAL